MKKEVLDYVIEKTHELMNAASCSSEAKAAAQSWLDAVGTEREADETKEYIAELEADIMIKKSQSGDMDARNRLVEKKLLLQDLRPEPDILVPNWQRILPHMLKK